MAPEFRGTVELGAEQDAASSTVSVIFPRTAAPDTNIAMEQLFEAFPDHEPTLSAEFEDHWVFQLTWTSDPRTFVDPGVSTAARSLYGLNNSEIGEYRELLRWGRRDVIISMVHSWALLAPANVTARRSNNPISWIVHFDDHTDLMAPFLEPISQSDSLRDHIFERNIDLANPDSVVAAVSRGVVSKGNFLTVYLLAHPGCRTVHIGHNLADQDFRLCHEMEIVELGGKRLQRHGFTFLPLSIHESWNFQQTKSIPFDLPVGEQEGVWLDIDLDYFCNRYNGDSDRRSEIAVPGERDKILERVDRFLTGLADTGWLSKIEAVSIAVSPGFFPAEYWAEIMSAIRDGLRDMLDN